MGVYDLGIVAIQEGRIVEGGSPSACSSAEAEARTPAIASRPEGTPKSDTLEPCRRCLGASGTSDFEIQIDVVIARSGKGMAVTRAR
jgi:hypothetical protein